MSQSIASYLHGLLVISIIGIISDALLSASSKNTKTMESALKLVFSLCLTLSVIIPGAEILKNTNLSEIFVHEETPLISEEEQSIVFLTKKQLENEISEKIYTKFGIKPTSISIQFVTEQNNEKITVDITGVNIELPSEHNTSYNEIYAFVTDLLGISSNTDGEE